MTLDGSNSQNIGPNGTATFPEIVTGDHQIELSGVASNCSVDGQNPRTISVEAGNTTSASYSVSCTATTGNLKINASTSGENQDADGYTVTVDGSNSQDIGPNGSVTFSELGKGDHQVELSGVTSNCSIEGDNPWTATVEADTTVSDGVNVTCSTTAGALEVSASTSGNDQDSDGYTVTVDGDASKELGPNGSTTRSPVPLTTARSRTQIQGPCR